MVHESVCYSCFCILFLHNWQLTFIIPQVLYLQTAFLSEGGLGVGGAVLWGFFLCAPSLAFLKFAG